MEQLNDAVGNPTALLIERFFWLGIGGFLGLAIISSLIRGLNESNNNRNSVSPTELKNLAKKAIQKKSKNS